MRKYFLSVILCVLGILCIISEPASAFEISVNDFDVIYTSVNPPNCRYKMDNTWGSWTYDASPKIIHNASSEIKLNGWRCRSGNGNDLSTQKGDIWTQYIRVIDYWPSDSSSSVYHRIYQHSQITYFKDAVENEDENNIVDFELVSEILDNYRRVQYYKLTGIVQKNTQNPDWGVQITREIAPTNQSSAEYYTVIQVMSSQQYRPKARLDYTNQLDDILEAIDGISVTTGVKEGMEEAMEDEKDQIQDASDESAEAGEDAKDQAENATSSLSDNIATIISAIKDTPKSNCTVSFGTRLNLNNLDMCAAPSNLLTAIRAVVIIPITLAVLRTSYNLIMMFWHLMRKEQE